MKTTQQTNSLPNIVVYVQYAKPAPNLIFEGTCESNKWMTLNLPATEAASTPFGASGGVPDRQI